MHIPVLLNEVLKCLVPKPGEFMIDATVNGGGHAEAILEKIGSSGKFLGIDWDESMITKLKTKNYKLQTIFAHGNYADLPEILEREKLGKADGLLLDLGFSSGQLEAGRGFSYKNDAEPLDMRYSKTEGIKTAAEIINSLREDELADILWNLGEERFSRQIAAEIVRERKKERILTAGQLKEVIKGAIPKFFKKGEAGVVARVFQALRIYVNSELDNLERILTNLEKIMAVGGRVVIITFHSLEDRLVKDAFIEMEENAKAKLLTKKPVIPEEKEITANLRSRSAKLRAIKII